ncbi:molybdenum cofactor biosynthesis protein MoaE [Marinicella rhabdoformis]|uniref:molybdenum cofactor biosynthesis protein MoaE n=1 Tax=Marinicella rhabdoformis TaxID=2580566 RepID=UPI0012AECFA9|nr:molybdenum cofactor biosynthesis protein MoaE [Marinicella rhabdoformis]
MFTLKDTAIDPDALKAQTENPKSGGYVCFEGWVRNHNNGEHVEQLHYSSHEKLALQVGNQIIEQAKQKFDINEAVCCHRVGELAIGDMAVWVGVSANHRKAAFEACEYILEEVKKEVPIWKNEHYTSGETGWVENNF